MLTKHINACKTLIQWFCSNSNLVCLSMVEFYSTVSKRWATDAEKFRNVTVLSVGGGHRDYQVRSGLTALSCPIDDLNKMSLVVGLLTLSKIYFLLKGSYFSADLGFGL